MNRRGRLPLAASTRHGEAPLGLRDALRQVSTGPDLSGLWLLVAIFAWFVGWNAMEAFFTIYTRSILGIEVGAGTQMLTAFAATLILFAIPSGLIATRVGRKPTILTGLGGMLVGLVVGAFVRNPTILLVVLAVMGAFRALVNTNSLPMVYDLSGQKSISSYTGLYYFASSAAAITGPILGGQLIDLTSPASIWIFSAVFMVCAIVCMSLVKPKAASTPA
jgi:maltose/moltooligosaccharide transporter